MKRLAMLLTFLFGGVAAADDQAPRPPQSPPRCDCPAGGVCVCGPGCQCPKLGVVLTAPGDDALDEVNAWRAKNGYKPFVKDAGLTEAARKCAAARAASLTFGHTDNDFAFLPAGCHADAAGCAAYPASYGWLSCCMRDGETYAGAAWAMGRDGKRYMHMYVSDTPNGRRPHAPLPPLTPPVRQPQPAAPAYFSYPTAVCIGGTCHPAGTVFTYQQRAAYQSPAPSFGGCAGGSCSGGSCSGGRGGFFRRR